MRRLSRTFGTLVTAIFVLALYPLTQGNLQGQNTRLPGAKPVVDARLYPSLQAAINEVPPEGGMVQLPPGVFEITEPLLITQNDILLQGSGTATHIKNIDSTGQPAILIQADEETAEEETALWRIQLENLRVSGNENSGHGIIARDINELYLEGITVNYHGGDGIRLESCYEDPRICSSLITYNKGTGLYLSGCHDIVVNGNQFEENGDALRCLDGFNLCMVGNNLDDHINDGVIIENTYGSVLSGNMIEECGGFAIILDRNCYGITIGSNVIAHNGGGVDLRDAHGSTVSANTFTIMKSHALRIGKGSGRIAVTGNNFSNSYVGDGEVIRAEDDQEAGGITLMETSNIAVDGNVFAGVQPKSVEVVGESSTRILFSDNLLVDVDGDYHKLDRSIIDNMLESRGQE